MSESKFRPGAGPGRIPGAREIAAEVLVRVERDSAFAAAALDTELHRYPQVSRVDRGLATELVYGCLRTRRALAERLREFSPRGIRGGPEVESHLLVAAYQIGFLDRIPVSAAVNEAVGAVRAVRGPKVGAFANALLRRLAQEGVGMTYEEAVQRSVPLWLWRRAELTLGPEEARGMFGMGAAGPPGVTVRMRGDAELPAELGAEVGRWCPRARTVRGRGHPDSWGVDRGHFVIQEEGAQVVALAVGSRPGDSVLDACAGRGGKTSFLAELVGPNGRVWATDSYPRKLEVLLRDFERLGLPLPETRSVDWTRGTGDVPQNFDRVLVDAPCSGTGTLRHRPEILARLQAEDPARIAEVSRVILRNAASRARVGGRVLFAVCSILPEECEQVVESVADCLEPVPLDAQGLHTVAEPGATSFRLLPGRHGTDGFFVASLCRR